MSDVYFDIETIPNFSKSELWDDGGRSSVFDTDLILSQPVAMLKKSLCGLDKDSLNSLLDSETFGKNRSSAVSAIEGEIKSVGSALKNAGLTPEYNRVVAIGYALDDGEIDVLTSDGTDDMEKEIIGRFWQIVGRHNRLIGYNISNFDIRVLVVRSALLGVESSGVYFPDLMNRYSNNVVDLMNARFPFAKAMKLKDLVVASGIAPLVEDIDGSQVFGLFEDDPELLAEYCKSDVYVIRELARKYKGYLYV